jgi:hypothetical protein
MRTKVVESYKNTSATGCTIPRSRKLYNQPIKSKNEPINQQNCGTASQPATEPTELSSAHTSVLKKGYMSNEQIRPIASQQSTIDSPLAMKSKNIGTVHK